MRNKDYLDRRNSNRIWKVACAVLLAIALVCTAVACAKKSNEDAAQDT